MKVKRYEGASEAVLMPIIMDEMGPGATIISVKEKPAKGFFALFRKPKIVITAAYEDDIDILNILSKPEAEPPPSLPGASLPDFAAPHVERKPLSADVMETNLESSSQVAIEESMALLLQEARKAANQIEIEESAKRAKAEKSEPAEHVLSGVAGSKISTKKYNHSMVQLFYDTMLNQSVLPDVAAHILRGLEDVDESSKIDVKLLIKAVYGNIVDILKNPILINTVKSEPEVIVFMGPTGVGKTTTIAKLSSILSLKHGLEVGLITADTYRIAAVEQLKTYADILGLEIRVVYAPDEISGHLAALKSRCDVILVDTAGRSHKHPEGLTELSSMLGFLPESKRYLVLSVTTRYEDLCKIVNVFDQLTDFSLIFTKLDEAETLGSLMNICCLAGKKAAYVTFGQNVPDDLEAIKPDKVAKALLGLGEGESHPYTPYTEGGSPS